MLPGEVDIPNWPTKASGVAFWQDLIEKMDRGQNSPSVPVLMGTNSYWVVSLLPSPHLNLSASVVWVELCLVQGCATVEIAQPGELLPESL